MQKINKIFILIIFLFTISFDFVSSSTLSFSPSGGTYRVGDTISVRVIVGSADRSINAVASRIVYPSEKIAISSISKTGSIISLWAQDPSFSNSLGNASFEGVILNGYVGSGARIVTVNFTAKSAGEASINFTNSSVLANDGEGTNILSLQNQAIFNILPAEVKSTVIPDSSGKPKTEDIREKIKDVSVPDEPKMITPMIVNYYTNILSVTDVLLIIVWVILLIVMVIFYVYYRFQIQKKIIKIKKITERNFKTLKEDQNNPEKLKHDIDNAKNAIVSNIEDMGKI